MDNMTIEQHKESVYEYVVAKDAILQQDELDAKVKEIADAMPPELAKTVEDNVFVKADVFKEAYYKQIGNEDKKPVTNPLTTQTTTVTTTKKAKRKVKEFVPSTDIPEEAKKALDEFTSADAFNKRLAVSKGSAVTKLLFLKESAEALHQAGLLKDAYVNPVDIDKFENKYKPMVEAYGDPANTKIFEKYVEDVRAKKEIPVEYSTSIGSAVGARVSVPSGKSVKELIKNKSEMIEFLIFEAAFTLEQQKGGLGANVDAVLKPSNSTVNDAAEAYDPKFVLKWLGQKEAKEDSKEGKNLREFVKEIAKDAEGKVELTRGLVTVAKQYHFKYVKDKNDIDPNTNKPRVSTCKPKISIQEFPLLKVKEVFKQHFHDSNASAHLASTKEEIEAAIKKTRNIYAGIVSEELTLGAEGFGADVQAMIKKVSEAEALDDKKAAAIQSAMA